LSIDESGLVAKDRLGDTALHFAAEKRRLHVVEYLVANGADISSTNYHNRVPLEVTIYVDTFIISNKNQDG
jgi:ankyrin repeat protein